jgi:hypothetical protein
MLTRHAKRVAKDAELFRRIGTDLLSSSSNERSFIGLVVKLELFIRC